MKRFLVAAAACLIPFAAPAATDDEVSEETVSAIMSMLEGMQCEMDEDDIEPRAGGGYELDDVFCADGQYDMDLDAALAVVTRRKE